ncbi:hypothetical protein EMIHUDRAFT_238451 [Emiliania huxleyi CCMP1516]|uniref:PLD phosphodiesterase domain-containing protein n=2 Tax=Emiliania huxleyi TaxID=2903 RepID=A0A0D3JLX5_EMIH1|nr:hypothetical protein EMIHUDRAFT_238451 [Emiliania huxleyi CCMP1516]EOD24510.1 hypothetical protein EMIHUDRAFT_238451 [Emiliania huxleyi CCMP1516]|eukprot:XP_005776939.1 hypothetical protein EMIHUDRAFT_238451 [Emiliania huxleyi CCMP1516]
MLTIVLSSNWARRFMPNVFICGEETVQMPTVPQYGQSPFLQGLNAVSMAIAAGHMGTSADRERRAATSGSAAQRQWKANMGNSLAAQSSEVATIYPPEYSNLSRIGHSVVNKLMTHWVEKGAVWDVWQDARFSSDWIVQHPPAEAIGQPSGRLEVPEYCDEDDGSRACDKDYHLYLCETDEDCKPKPLCPDQGAGSNYFTCEGTPKMLCAGHSRHLYEKMYDMITRAHAFVDVTSLDSPDTVGWYDIDDSWSTGWGTQLGHGYQFTAAFRDALTFLANDGRSVTVKLLFGSVPLSNENTRHILETLTRDMPTSGHGVTVHVGTYRVWADSWNHGKIIAVDGQYLLQGGSNYYAFDYLMEDPVMDVSMVIEGGATVTAHRYAAKLWQSTCRLGVNRAGGNDAADFAFLALMESAQTSLKFSQQDMLPVIFSGISGSVISANVYGTTGFMADKGFEDTWMIIGGLARALVRGVDVYVLLSAPCSFGANDPDAAGLDGGDMCPIDGSPPSGFNLWSQKRSRARKLGGKDASETSLTRNHRQLTYGYGWTLENTADWIFAYLAIHPEERPQSAHGPAASNELINLICKRAHIAHVRVAASEATYGTRADGTQVRTTQIGNHAKVIMADDSAFYMGSNNAYGAGLAEFGLIVDDAEKARELDNNYYSPLWQQAKAGAVSGSDAIGFVPNVGTNVIWRGSNACVAVTKNTV